MITFIDESGSFVESTKREAWNVVAAYVTPERTQTRSLKILAGLKRAAEFSVSQEIKLDDITEDQYIDFVKKLSELPGTLFATATDAGLNTAELVIQHRNAQAENIRSNGPRMLYESGKRAVEKLAADLESLAPQLYVQLQCQVRLVDDVLRRGTIYYAQRDPTTLRRFKWRVDQKTNPQAIFEKTFRTTTAMFLQSISARKPMFQLQEADYSYMTPYEYAPGEIPDFYTEHFGPVTGPLKTAINIGKIIQEDLQFPDSKTSEGIQIADLLASGLRRGLRAGFARSELVMTCLAKLAIRDFEGEYPIKLIGFDPRELPVGDHVARCMRSMVRHSRNLLTS